MEVHKPHRATRTFTQILAAPVEHVFPLLCPVREAEWVHGWDPVVVYSASGVAEDECVFQTADEWGLSTWIMTRHDEGRGRLEFVKATPNVSVARIEIRLYPMEDERTAAEITYSHTAIGQKGVELVDAFTEEAFIEFMTSWERDLNAFLNAQ